MLESLLVYTITAFILYRLALANICLSTNSKFWTQSMICSVIVFAFIAGARYNVGVDFVGYLNTYSELVNGEDMYRDDMEWGFMFLSNLLAGLHFHSFFYFALWATMQIAFIYYAFKDSRYLIPYLAFCIMLGPYFLDWMNGIRQNIVICGFVFASRFIKEQKFKKYLLFIGIAYLFHHSVVLLLPFYLIGRKYIVLEKKITNILILLFCIIVGSTPSWISAFSFISHYFELLGMDRYGGVFNSMIDGTLEFQTFDWGPTKLAVLALEMLIIYTYPKMRRYFLNTNIDLYFTLFYIGICWYYLVQNTTLQMVRPTMYFTIFRLPLTCFLLYYASSIIRSKGLFNMTCILCFSYIFITIYKGYSNPIGSYKTVLYHFFFEY